MEPFGLALGMNSDEFAPWRDAFSSRSDAILLVEGDIDKAYFELLLDERHGSNRLDVSGDIVPYDGMGSLKNQVLLKFVLNRSRKVIVTYDLDVEGQIERNLKALNLKKNRDYFAVGKNAKGKQCIEGLLPDSVVKTVYAENVDLVRAAMNGAKDDKTSAKSNLKLKLYEEFANQSREDISCFESFYPLVKKINKALKG